MKYRIKRNGDRSFLLFLEDGSMQSARLYGNSEASDTDEIEDVTRMMSHAGHEWDGTFCGEDHDS